ncbi:MAG: hypothetical protein ACR2PS_10880 [Pseudomonadales bacterium]
MSDPIFKLQLLARSEITLTEIHARRVAARTIYLGIALVLCLIGLAMFNFAGYLALEARMTPAMAALCMALLNGVAAAIVVFLSGKAGPSEGEERMAREIREMAYKEVSQDVEEVKGRLENLATEVSSIGENVTRATSAIRFMLGLLKKDTH